MNLLRKYVDSWYDARKNEIFERTKDDPERAHEELVRFAKRVHRFKLEKLLFHCSENKMNPGFEISNAAGFNKNAEIPPTFLKYLGFDRIVIGTITADAWAGAERPRIRRYPRTMSMVNWMELPGIGAEDVAYTMANYGYHGVPVTINLMATPGKQGDEILEDLERSVLITKDLPHVDRYELNISCPNTHGSSGALDARREYQEQNDDMLRVLEENVLPEQEIWEKVSPDLDFDGVKDIVDVARGHRVCGFVTANTTTRHDPLYIDDSPGKGGASGCAVSAYSKGVQRMFEDYIEQDFSLIACGGIENAYEAKIRVKDSRVRGVQVFTPLVFRGPRLLRELRSASEE